jgi:di/tricarboxylate transporter
MIPEYLQTYVVIAIIVVSFFLIYRKILKPTITLLLANLVFVLTGIIDVGDLLGGLANESIISILLLILLTAGIRKNFDIEMLFDRVYRNITNYKQFLLAMMAKVAVVSSLMNNTPVVAAMTPYVFNWGKKNKIAPSKLLIPLSYATICGGMITLIGTSTTLVLNGFLIGNNLPSLNVTHIFIIGTTVTLLVLLYIVFIGHRLLPEKPHLLEDFNKNRREYLIETILSGTSSLAGKSITEAGLRNLPGVYLVEIIRDNEIISPVEPASQIQSQDVLIFAGNTSDIMEFVTSDQRLRLPDSATSLKHEDHRLIEVVVSNNSSLIGNKIQESDFRNRYNAAIVAMHRNGERMSGKIGEQQIQAGDLLLLYAGEQFQNQLDIYRDLFVISELREMKKPAKNKILGISITAVVALVLLVTGAFSLFTSLLVVFAMMASFKMISMQDLKREVDLSLLAILVFSLSLGTAVVKSGAGSLIANMLVEYFSSWGIPGILGALLLVTTLLTSFISNVGAVSVTFPIAMALSESLDLENGMLYLGIAFAASAAFSTPIGYQTNLMVYGPGGYNFKDFFRAGLPVTLIYLAAVFVVLILLYPNVLGSR